MRCCPTCAPRANISNRRSSPDGGGAALAWMDDDHRRRGGVVGEHVVLGAASQRDVAGAPARRFRCSPPNNRPRGHGVWQISVSGASSLMLIDHGGVPSSSRNTKCASRSHTVEQADHGVHAGSLSRACLIRG